MTGRRAAEETDGSAQVDAYLAGLDQPQRDTLARLRATLRTILPHADEGLKYGMPAVSLHGVGVAGYAGFRAHCGNYPMSGTVLEAAGPAVAGYVVSKGGLQFSIEKPPPTSLVRKLVALRLAEISSVRDGKRREYYPDGALKAVGSMKDGELHGAWEWFRRDGSPSRAGRFSYGDQVGTWTTFDRDGNAVRSTTFT